MKKRILSVFLALTLVLGMMPFTVMADDDGTDEETSSEDYYCGDEAQWYIDGNTLYITGSGAMYDYEQCVAGPWYDYVDDIYSIVIEEGITYIGTYAFWYMYNVTEVSIASTVETIACGAFDTVSASEITIPASVTYIGDYAFVNCWYLESITFEEGSALTYIGAYAFQNCYCLSSVVFPDSLEEIAEGAFENCESLTSVTFPASLVTIGDYAFAYCYSLSELNFAEDGNLTTIGNSAFYNDYSLTSIIIPDSVETIGAFAFANIYEVDELIIGSGVKYIGGYAFNNVYYSGDLVLPDGLETICIYAFAGTNMESITIPTSVSFIGGGAFFDVGEVIFTDGNENLTVIDGVVFSSDMTRLMCVLDRSITSYEIPDGVTSILYAAFEQCTELTEVSIPDTVVLIEGSAFGGCSSLTGIVIPENAVLTGDNTFGGCSSLSTVTFNGNCVTEIGPYAFAYCYSLTEITLPDSVETIDEYAFYNDYSLISIDIPDSVTYIGTNAFAGTALTSFYIPASCYVEGNAFISSAIEYFNVSDENPYYAVDDCGVLYSADYSELIAYPSGRNADSYTVLDGTTSIGACAFFGTNYIECSSWLTSLTIPASVTYIGEQAFCNIYLLYSLIFEGSAPEGYNWFGDEVTADVEGYGTYTTIYYPAGDGSWSNSKMEEITNYWNVWNVNFEAYTDDDTWAWGYINDDVQWKLTLDGTLYITGSGSVDSYAYNNWYDYIDSITAVVIEEGITEIYEYAFAWMYNIQSLTLPTTVTAVYDSAFRYCYALSDINFAEDGSLWYIGGYAFNECLALESITFPASLEYIDYNAFDYCTGLVEINFAEDGNLYYIGVSAFLNCDSLISVTIPEGITWIYESTFQSCDSLTEVVLSDTVEGINGWAFCDNYALTDITWSENLWYIGESSFANCDSLTSVILPDSVNTVDIEAFASCDSLQTISTDAAYIYDGAFAYNTNVTSLTLSSGVEYIGSYAFQNIGNDTSSGVVVTIPDTVYEISGDAFSWSGVRKLTLGSGLETIGDYAFCGCSRLHTVSIPDNVTYMGKYAFAYCDITSLSIGAGLTEISDSAFQDNSNLYDISIPDNIESIGEYSFAYIYDVDDIYIGSGVKSIGAYAFYETYFTSIELPDGLESIGAYAFSNSGLSSITIPSSVTYIGGGALQNIGTITFEGDNYTIVDNVVYTSDMTQLVMVLDTSITSFEVPDGVTSINDSAFEHCYNLESITLPDSLESIGTLAFEQCYSLTSIILPEGITVIQDTTFRQCQSLTSVTFNGNVTYIGAGAFYNCCSLESITLPESVEYIGDEAFTLCGLTSFNIPESASYVSSGAFNSCKSLEYFTVSDGNAYYAVDENGVLYSADYSTLVSYPCGNTAESYTVLDGTSEISTSAFAGLAYLTSITVPASVNYVGNSAFARGGSTSLASVTFEGSAPDGDGGVWFEYGDELCDTLFTVYYPAGDGTWFSDKMNEISGGWENISFVSYVQDGIVAYGYESDYMGWRLFDDGTLYISGTGSMYDYEDCGGGPWRGYVDEITSIVIGDGITYIGTYAFWYMYNVTEISISSTVETIAEGAFTENYEYEIVIPSSVTYIGYRAFQNSYNLESITFEEGSDLLNIDGEAFINCTSLTSVTFPDRLEWIGDYVFYNCTALSEINFAEDGNLYYIGTCAFSCCESLTSVTLPASVSYTGENVFSFCYSLVEFNFAEGSSLEGINSWVFSYCTSLAEITLPDSITYINYRAFEACSLESIYIPENVTYIGEEAFLDCSSLSEVIFEGNLPDGYSIFGYDNWGNIITVYIPSCYSSSLDGYRMTELTSGVTVIWETYGNHTYSDVTLTEYNGHYYYIYEIEDITTWEAAVAYCESVGGYMASITSAEEDSFLYAYVIASGYSNAYFGLTDEAEEGTWVWVNGEEVVYTNWNEDEPNGGTDENYGKYALQYTDGTWNDCVFNEDGWEIAFLCEWDSIEDVPEELASYGAESVTEATCTEDGYYTYICSVCGEEFTVVYEEATGHSYDSALCYFSISGSSAAAVFILTCSNDASHTVTLIADVTSVEDEETGTVTYTATAEYDGVVYEDTFTADGLTSGSSGSSIDEDYTGLYYDTDSDTWFYYADGVVDTSYTGLASNAAGTWYVEDGIVDFTYTGTVTEDEVTYYVVSSRVMSYTGLYKIDDIWYYLIEGVLASDYTGLAENVSGTWYIEDGTVNFDYTGFVEIDGDTYYVEEGLVDMTDGLEKIDGTWYYLVSGVICLDYTGFATNSNGTWYVEDGVISFTYTGFVEDEDGNTWYVSNSKVKTDTGLTNISGTWYYLEDGVVVTDYNGLAENSYGTWYLEDGVINFDYTGLYTDEDGTTWYISNGKLKDITTVYKVDGVWYYFVSGAVAYDYTGLASNTSGTWYVEEGIVSLEYTGLYEDEDGVTWYISESAVSTKSGVLKVNGTWYYIVDGVVQYDYTGLASNSSGTWYVENGVVTFTYNGTVTIDGVEYTIVNSKVSS